MELLGDSGGFKIPTVSKPQGVEGGTPRRTRNLIPL